MNLSIEGGKAASNLTSLSLSLAATDATQMFITNSPDCASGGSWEPFVEEKSNWTISENNAMATVYAKFRNENGIESDCISDTILHDDQAPSSSTLTINGGTSINVSSTSLSLSSFGADEMFITNTASCLTGGTWETYSTEKTLWTLAQSNTTATVYVMFRDNAGNESACVSDTILHDDQGPTSSSILINGGDAVNLSFIDLSISSVDASEMYITDSADCATGGAWETYSSAKSAWPVSQTNSTVMVYAKFRDTNGNESTCVTDSIIHDDQGPTSSTITIDGGETISTNSPNLLLTSIGASEMYITNSSGCATGGSWETYATNKGSWTLAQTEATATVYAKFRDLAGNESSCINDTVVHSTQGPTSSSIVIDGGNDTSDPSPNLTLNSTNASEMYITNTSGCLAGGTWEAYATSKGSWTLAQNNSTASVFVKFRDAQGNQSSCIQDSINHDDTAPSSTSMSIDGGSHTNAAAIIVNLAAVGATEVYITESSACATGGSWSTFASTKPWTLSQTNATIYVYAKYRDAAGNESACLNDSIIHDNMAPSGVGLTIASTEFTSQSNPNIFPIASDASEMYVTNTSSCATDGTWESFASTKSAWPLAQTQGLATVYVKYRDEAGNESTCVSDSITHDSTSPLAPTDIHDGTITGSADTSRTITWTASTDSGGSGIGTYEISLGSSAGATDEQNWLDVGGNVTSFTLNGLSLNWGSEYFVNLRSIDQAQNISPVTSGDGFVYGYAQKAYVKASNGDIDDRFGHRVAISGDTMIVSAIEEDSNQSNITSGSSSSPSNSSSSAGAVYVYRLVSGVWQQEAYLKASNSEPNDEFGYSIDIHGDTIVVGAVGEESSETSISYGPTGASADNSNPDSGAVYVFKRSGISWVQEAYIKAANGAANDYFGEDVAIDGNTIVVGARGEDSNQSSITNGTSADFDNSSLGSGAAYVYKRNGSVWAQEAYIKASNSDSADLFGSSVDISGDTIVVGAFEEDGDTKTVLNGTIPPLDDNNVNSGAAYVYKRTGTNWAEEAYLKASNADSSDMFGASVAIFADLIVVGAYRESSNSNSLTNGSAASNDNSSLNSGAAYVFMRTGANWAQQAYLKPTNAKTEDLFGTSVAISGDTIVVGSHKEDSESKSVVNGGSSSILNNMANSGAAYVFHSESGQWVQKAYLKASNGNAYDEFARSVAIDGNKIVVGSEGEDENLQSVINGKPTDSANSSSNQGAAYIFGL